MSASIIKGALVPNATAYNLYEKVTEGDVITDLKGCTWVGASAVLWPSFISGNSATKNVDLTWLGSDGETGTSSNIVFAIDDRGEDFYTVTVNLTPSSNFMGAVWNGTYGTAQTIGQSFTALTKGTNPGTGSEFVSCLFTGGTDSSDPDLIAWLQANGTLSKPSVTEYIFKATNTEINFDLKTLNLSEGPHTFVVQATAQGYESSDYSNEVTYTAGGGAELITFRVIAGSNRTDAGNVLGTYQCPAGYTWRQFIESEYNNDGEFTIGSSANSTVYYDNAAEALSSTSVYGRYITGDVTVLAQDYYQFKHESGGSND